MKSGPKSPKAPAAVVSGDTFISLLRQKGHKITPARLAVLAAFVPAKRGEMAMPLNAELITKKIGKKNINEVTVYRTLSAFEKSGILKRVDLRKDSIYFEMNDIRGEHPHAHHHHIVCTGCGGIEDFEICDVDSLVGRIAAGSSKFKLRNIKEHSLELFGLCTRCA